MCECICIAPVSKYSYSKQLCCYKKVSLLVMLPGLFKVFSYGGFEAVCYNRLWGVVMIWEREGFLPRQFGGEAMSMRTRVTPHGTRYLMNTQFPMNWKLEESVHLMMCFTNEVWINPMIDHLEEAMFRASFTNELSSMFCRLIIPSEKPIKVHHWCLELVLCIHQVLLWPNEIGWHVV